MSALIRWLAIAVEGLRFLWAFRDRRRVLPLPPFEYLAWRLETVYGVGPSSMRDAFRMLWRDRANVARFLEWRRSMRLRLWDG